MINCEHIQEMLLSDYHDGRLGARQRQDIDSHLLQCADCRLLSERIYAQAIKPFNQMQPAMPDEFCWSQIKRHIAQQPVVAPKPFAWAMRPAWASLSLCMMFMVGSIVFQQYQAQQTPYMSYMLASDTEGSDEVSSSIEEYFL